MCDHGQVDTPHSMLSHLISPGIGCCSAVKEVGRHEQIRASRVLAAFRSAALDLAGTRRLVESFEQESLPALESLFKVQFPENSVFLFFKRLTRRARVCSRSFAHVVRPEDNLVSRSCCNGNFSQRQSGSPDANHA